MDITILTKVCVACQVFVLSYEKQKLYTLNDKGFIEDFFQMIVPSEKEFGGVE